VSIYHEARDQPLLGQQAVAAVILRRVEVSRWGDTICAVVRPVQFSYLDADYGFAPIREPEAWRGALTVAVRALLDGPTPLVSGADHYHATYVSPTWRRQMSEVVRIGSHVFYRDPLSAARDAAASADPAEAVRMAAKPAVRSSH
jgi:spore germination cell wall hydrolase CwlJ-like protein